MGSNQTASISASILAIISGLLRLMFGIWRCAYNAKHTTPDIHVSCDDLRNDARFRGYNIFTKNQKRQSSLYCVIIVGGSKK